MPQLTDEMYCSEQICIPPTFPFLLRQFAKAAIRSQPTDLLSWSAAYFRCLALNIPPPVKPRLEYPIPRDHCGITPGWLRALNYQLQNNPTITFRVLFDRWIGTCLPFDTLIRLLCLGQFDDPQAVPWNRFIAICASHLTDSLTETMILICEVLTEEPEGGSAMITLETFKDLYVYLAHLDAAEPKTMLNYHFPESLLSYWREKLLKAEADEEIKEEVEADEVSSGGKSTVTTDDGGGVKEDVKEIISCPSLVDDNFSMDYYLKIAHEHQVVEVEEEEDVEDAGLVEMDDESKETEISDEQLKSSEEDEEEEVVEEDETPQPQIPKTPTETPKEEEEKQQVEEDKSKVEKDESKEEVKHEEHEKGEETEKEEKEIEEEVAVEKIEEEIASGAEITSVTATTTVEEEQPDVKEGEEDAEQLSVDTVLETPRNVDEMFQDDQTLREDLERLKALQQEIPGETDDELEKFKCRLIEEMPMTKSQESAIGHYRRAHDLQAQKDAAAADKSVKSSERGTETTGDDEDKYDKIYTDAVPGIGPVVPEHLITAVLEYMEDVAKIQHGMVMPRNIRNYRCPPLEVVEC